MGRECTKPPSLIQVPSGLTKRASVNFAEVPEIYSLTTPSYYVNSLPHIGTALTTVLADVCARYQRMNGRETLFLTGTDENGLKVLQAAKKAGKEPQQFVDDIAAQFQQVWQAMGVEYDDFLRTTEPRHREAVAEVWRRLRDKGHIYADRYEGWYDVSTETFYQEQELVDGKSPDGNPVEWVAEENWFFRTSAFAEPLLKHIEENPNFILPETRKNEVVSFIRQGLRDTCVSRKNPGWGVPVPDDPERVVYVWFDALINYLAATGWPAPGYEKAWPNTVEWMGKDILTRFHATLWPSILLGLELPLPETLVGHAWVLLGADKISKSKGNVVAPLDLAKKLSERTGATEPLAVDAVRWYMCSTAPFESDSVFTDETFEGRYNADLANDLGNALNRSLNMIHRFYEGKIPCGEIEPAALEAAQNAKKSFEAAMSRYRIDEACHAALEPARFLNKYVDDVAPWNLAKTNDPRLPAVFRSMVFLLRTCEGLVRPVMPSAADAIASQLGLEPLKEWKLVATESSLPQSGQVAQPQPMFPRIEKERKQQEKPVEPQPKPEPEKKPQAEPIGIEDFAKVEFRIARVLEAEPVPNADKLLKLQLLVGEEKRQVVAGIRKSYDPEQLIGRQVVIVFNLKPATLRGVESQGMLLAADDGDGGAILLSPDRVAPEGAKVR
ncbi:MAG: methionine--tRNA ligase [Fimbriimonadaceae bacterium]